MYISYTLVTIICSLMLYPGYTVTEKSVEDVVTTSKRAHCHGRKRQDVLHGTKKIAVASCLTERKLNEASKPLIIPGNVFVHRSFAAGQESFWKEMAGSTRMMITHAIL